MPLQEIFGVRIKSAVFSFSLLAIAILIPCASLGQGFSQIAPQVRSAATAGEVADILRGRPGVSSDASLSKLLDEAEKSPERKDLKKDLVDAVDLRAAIETPAANDDASTAIKKIQSNPLYLHVNERRSSNWVGDTMDKIKKLFPHIKKPKVKAPEMPKLSGLDAFVRAVVWVILAALLIVFLTFAVKYWSFRRSLQRRASAVLEEDEPERTLDEWLTLANSLEAQGKYREAIRCLYLACLLKFDEAGVARFVRSHTNWEHLSRIQSSAKNPGINFLPITQAFDLAWYGFRVKGPEDIVAFREAYENISAILGGMK